MKKYWLSKYNDNKDLFKENKKNSEIWISSSNEKINITKRNKLYKKGSIEIIYIEGKE